MVVLWLLFACNGARIADLEARVVALEAENQALEQKAAELEQRAAESARIEATKAEPPRADGPNLPVAVIDGVHVMRRADVTGFDFSATGGLLRIIPHRGPDGEIDGYRVAGIRRDSLPARLGLKNGDIVHQVNGSPLGSTEQTVAAWGKHGWPETSEWLVEVSRRGVEQQPLVWRVVE